MPERKLNILDLIQGSFADANEEKIPKYLDRLYAAISDYTQNIRRDSLLVLLLVTAFELVNSSPGAQFSVASFSFHKGSVVLQVVPAVVAYLFLQIITDSIRLADMGIAFRRLFGRWLGGREYPGPAALLCRPHQYIGTSSNRFRQEVRFNTAATRYSTGPPPGSRQSWWQEF